MTTINDIQYVEKSSSNNVNSLLGDGMSSWNYLAPSQGNVLYYTFDSFSQFYSDDVTDINLFNTAQENSAQQLLTYASSVTGITFQETHDSSLVDLAFYYGDINGASTSGLTESKYQYSYIGETVTSYDALSVIYLDNNEFSTNNANPVAGGQGYETLLHELGHALGLKHPFEGTYQLPSALDNTNYTVMSYTDAGSNKSEFQSLDVDALWWLYGGDGLGGTYGINSTQGPILFEDMPTVTASPQADIFLYASGLLAFGSSANVYGAVGQEAVLVESGANNVTIDQNVERVELSGSTSDYTYLQAGNQLQVFSSGVKTTTIAVGSSGTDVAFSNGSAQLRLSAGVMTLGGATVSNSTAGSLSVSDIDGTYTSISSAILGETDSQAGVFMTTGGSIILGGASEVYGTSGNETALVHNGVHGIFVDQNVERLDLAGSSQDFAFQQSGNQILIYQGGQLSVRLAVQGDGTDVAFTDGLAQAYLSAGQMTLGNTVLSTTTPGTVTPQSMNTSVVSGISARIQDEIALMGQGVDNDGDIAAA